MKLKSSNDKRKENRTLYLFSNSCLPQYFTFQPQNSTYFLINSIIMYKWFVPSDSREGCNKCPQLHWNLGPWGSWFKTIVQHLESSQRGWESLIEGLRNHRQVLMKYDMILYFWYMCAAYCPSDVSCIEFNNLTASQVPPPVQLTELVQIKTQMLSIIFLLPWCYVH